MKAFFIPGNSVENREWNNLLCGAFNSDFSERFILEYDHWNLPGTSINLRDECIKLGRMVTSKAGADKYGFVAKSIGCIVSLVTIAEYKLQPEFMVFVGFPLHMAEQNKILETLVATLKTYKHKVLFIQKPEDRVGSFQEITNWVKGINSPNLMLQEYRVLGEPLDTHHYENVSHIRDIVKNAQLT